VIKPDGTVSSAKADGLDPTMAACIENAVRQLQFPAQRGEIKGTYPMTFKAS
jgi:hypothetical protein